MNVKNLKTLVGNAFTIKNSSRNPLFVYDVYSNILYLPHDKDDVYILSEVKTESYVGENEKEEQERLECLLCSFYSVRENYIFKWPIYINGNAPSAFPFRPISKK